MAVRPPTRPAGPVPPAGSASLPAPGQLRALLDEVVSSSGAVLEDVTVTRAGRRAVVTVLVDGADAPLDLDAVAAVSHGVSDALDAAPATLLPGAYTLEVSSPGVERPLTLDRHWRRALGRLVTVHRHGEPTVTGRVVEVVEGEVALDGPGPRGRPARRVTLSLGDIARAVVQVELSRATDAHDEEVAP